MKTRTLITGGAGFIGAHLAARCVTMGHDVHVLVRAQTSLHRLDDIAGQVTIHRVELDDPAGLRACFGAILPHRVFHLATITRPADDKLSDVYRVIEDLRNLLLIIEICSEISSPPVVVVRSGSIAEYGPLPMPYHENQQERPASPYAAGLAAGTDYIRLLQAILPFPVITARLALVYGPQQSDSFLIPSLIQHCLDHQPRTINRPDDRRDLLHIDDAVDALCQLADRPPAPGTVVNISTGTAPTMRETAQIILKATQANAALITFNETPAAEPVSELRASPDLARRLIGWTARTSLEQGIEKTVTWIRDRCHMPSQRIGK